MAELWDTSTNERVEIPDADAPAAVLSGRYGIDASKEVLLKRPDGKMVVVPATSAPEAFEKGYTFGPQTDLIAEHNAEKYGEFGAKVLSGAAGVARGLSLGLSDRALRNAGVEASTLRDLDEGAPFISGAGEVAGTLLPAVFTGGTSVGAQGAVRGVGAVAAKGALRKAGAKALQLGAKGAVEGAVYGVGHAVSEDALGRADLNAESLIANAGLGAVIGGGGGVLLGGGGSLLASGAKKAVGAANAKIGSGTIQEALEDFAGKRILKATVGPHKGAIKQIDKKGLTDRAEKYLLKDMGLGNESILGGAKNTTEVIAEKLATKADELRTRLDDFVTRLDDATKNTPIERLSPRQVAKRIEDDVARPLKKIAATQDEYRAVMREVKTIRALGNKGMSFAEARAQRAAVQDKINYKVDAKPLVQARRDIAKIWNDVIDETAEPVLVRLGEQTQNAYRAVREEFSLVKELLDHAQNRVQGSTANRLVSPSSYGIGLATGVADAASGGAMSVAKGAVTAAAHQQVLERGNAFAANIAYKLSQLQAVQKASASVSARVNNAVNQFVQRPRGAVTRAVAPATVQFLSGVSFGTSPPKAATKVASRNDAAKERSRELSLLMGDPAKAADRIAFALTGLDESAPGISGQVAMTAAKALQFLHAKAPKNPQSANTLQPLLDDWRPTDAEVAKFERYTRAALQPLTVLDDLEAGTLTPEAAEALKTLYPQLHRMTVERLTAKLAESPKKLPYEDRVNLSLLLGAPVDDTMTPEFIRRSQALWTQKPSSGQGAGGQRLAGIDTLDMAGRMASPTQQLEVKR